MIEEVWWGTEEEIVEETHNLQRTKLGVVFLIEGASGEVEVTVQIRADADLSLRGFSIVIPGRVKQRLGGPVVPV